MGQKKKIRAKFKELVFQRDGFTCCGCGLKVTPDRADKLLDSHHITDRTLLPGGGYVKENGISLCKKPGGCHEKAEAFHSTGKALPGFSPEDLYKKIGSSRDLAERASLVLTA